MNIIPKICPVCSTYLKIEEGESKDVLKLVCPNINCGGPVLKKLEKGVSILKMRNIGPATIKKLHMIGVDNIIKLFDKDVVSEEKLIQSGEFKEGKSLNRIIESINSVNSIKIDNAINSLQLYIKKNSKDDYIPIGKSLSYQIAKKLSGLDYSFEGLSNQIEHDIENKGETYNKIKELLKSFEDNKIKIKLLKENNFDESSSKKINKKISFDTNENYSDIINELGWEETKVENSDILVVDNKNQESEKIEKAKQNNVKIITFKQFKILFL